MKYSLSIVTLLYVFIIMSVIACNSGKVEENLDSTKKAELIIYPGASNIKYKNLFDGKLFGVLYDVKIRYPAKEIIDFYEREMSKKGYKPFNDKNHSERNWSYYQDATIKGSPDVASYVYTWSDTQQTKIITLILKYFYKSGEKKIVLSNNDNLTVIFQIAPFSKEKGKDKGKD